MDVEVISSSGALNATLPIAVPPGRNDLTPGLELVYNSFHLNGWLGVGWDLNPGSIKRSTRHGLDYASVDFDVVEDGAYSELTSRPDWGFNYYGRKIERIFSKFSFRGNHSGWIVFKKDGRRYYYGTTEGSRMTTAKGVFSWHLNRVEDASGNYMTFSYQKDEGQIYLAEVSYTGHAQTGLAPSKRVKFILSERADKILDGRAAEVAATSKLLSAIQVYAGTKLCRKYQFEYEQGLNSGRSRLVKILPFGADGVSALPPIVLDWHQGGTPDFGNPIKSYRTISYPDRLGDQEKVSLADVNGDARTDIVISRGQRMYHRISNGDGTFDSIDLKQYHNLGEVIGHADVNGDGYSDIVSYQRSYDGAPLYFYVLFGRGDGTYASPVISKMPGILREPLLNPNPAPGDWDQTPPNPSQGRKLRCAVHLADVNGDGLSDVTFYYAGFWGHKLSNGDGTFCACDKTIHSKGETLGLLDINSDGLADILSWRYLGKYTYFYVNLGKGDGTYEKTIQSVVVSYSIPVDAAPFLGDFNGDGLTDVVLNKFLQCWPMLAGADGKYTIGDMFSIPSMTTNQIYFADVTGDGVDDILGFHDYFQAYRQYFSVSTGQVAASQDLIESITDSTGARYAFDYRPSSEYSNGVLPFAVKTVAKVRIDDGVGSISETRFTYSNGRFDSKNRSFAGFGYAQQTNPDQSVVESWFHQDEYLKGLAYKIEHLEPGAASSPLSRTTIDWHNIQLTTGRAPSMFVYPNLKTTEFIDNNAVFIRDRYEYNIDNGNLLAHETSGTNAEMITRKFEYQNFSDWFWRKTDETLEGESGGPLRKSIFNHENITGNLLSVSNWLHNGQDPLVRFTYDEYGNRISVTDARGYVSSIDYDNSTHTYPVRRTNPLGHTNHFTWDDRFGQKTSVVDENNNETIYRYDAFGRLMTLAYPDGGFKSYQYDVHVMPRVVVSRTRQDVAGATVDQYEYFDGLGRKVQTVSFGEGGKRIVNRLFYDAMGRKDLIEGPFFSPSSLGWPMAPPTRYPWKQVSFDFLGRPISVESADGDHGSVVTTSSYDGFSSSVTDPDGAEKVERRDYLGRIIEVIERSGQGDFKTGYSYDAAGSLLKVVDNFGHTTLIVYDTLGRKVQMSDPDMGVWHYLYDANNNIVSQIDAKLQTVAFAYDPLNRLVSKNYSTEDPSVSYEYDNSGVPNGIGRLCLVSNSVVMTSNNAYNEMGRVLSVSKAIAGNPQTFTTEFGYDLSGKQVRMSYPDGYQLSNAFYPGTHLLQKVTGADGTEFAHLTAYEPSGKIGRMDHGNATYTIHSYDPDTARISSIVTGRLGPVDTFQEKHYRYSKAGDITRITDKVDDVVFDYTYDKLHRLTGETSNRYDPISYTYDAIGNITSKTIGSTSMVYSYDSAHPHAVKQISLNGTPYDLLIRC